MNINQHIYHIMVPLRIHYVRLVDIVFIEHKHTWFICRQGDYVHVLAVARVYKSFSNPLISLCCKRKTIPTVSCWIPRKENHTDQYVSTVQIHCCSWFLIVGCSSTIDYIGQKYDE